MREGSAVCENEGLHGGWTEAPFPLFPSFYDLRCLFKEFSVPLVIYLDSTLPTAWRVTDPTLPSLPQSPGPFHLQLAALALLQASQIGGTRVGVGGCSISRNPRVPHPGTLGSSGVL